MQFAEVHIKELRKEKCSREEYESLGKSLGKMVTGVQYQSEDLRNLIKDTDIFIEKFLPFKILKLTGKYLLDLFGEQIEEKVLSSERDKMKALYLHMLDDKDQATFKE